jgi:hypothetical protein
VDGAGARETTEGVRRGRPLTAQNREPGYIESGQRLIRPEKPGWNQHELLAAAQRAQLRNTGWPIGLVLQRSGFAPVPTPDGVEARLSRYGSGRDEDVWYLHKDGSYYFSRLFEEDFETPRFTSSAGHPERCIWFDVRIWRIAEVFLHSAVLYRELGVPPEEPYALVVNHGGLEGREFYVSNLSRHVHRGMFCHSPAATWTREVTQDYLTGNLKDLVEEVASNLFVLFDFVQVGQEAIGSIVDKFLQSRV